MLNKISNEKKVEKGWERTHQELRKFDDKPNIVGTMKGYRLKLLGHIIRMPGERMPIKLLESETAEMERR